MKSIMCACLIMIAATLPQPAVAQSFFGRNLIVNPGAEEGPVPTGNPPLVRPIPGWDVVLGNFTIESYGAPGGFPSASSPGPPNRGARFFAGGPNVGTSYARQDIAIPPEAIAAIDAGVVTYELSGWAGGFASQSDNAIIELIFMPGSTRVTLAPIGPELRNGVTGLLRGTLPGTIPKGTRKLQVLLNMLASPGQYNDAYVDELSLVLTSIPFVTSAGIANAASYQAKGVAPGEILAIFGIGLGPDTAVIGSLTRNAFDTSAAGVRVLFDNIPAPLIYVSSTQVSAVAPYALFQKSTTQVAVSYNGVLSAPVTLNVVDSLPGVVSLNASGSGQGAILNENGALNNVIVPATPGSIVVFYATGEGQTFPAGADGALALGPIYPKPILPVGVTIGGREAEILYYGAAPGLVAGAMQVNARIPNGTPPGNAPIVLRVGQNLSPPTVTVAVK